MLPVMLTGVSSRTGAARAGGIVGQQPVRAPLARRYWPALAALAGVAVLFYCAQRQARQMGVQSDGAAMELQAWAMLHGNLLLHGWYLSDVSFYTTELPEYALVEIARGLNPDVVRLAAALTYTLLVVLAAAVAYGSRPPARRTAAVRAAIAVVVMLGPTASATNTLLNDPDHTGTAVPVLLALLILDRGRRRWWGPPLAAVVLGWALVGDSLVLLIGVAPLVAVGGMRAFALVALERRPLSAAWHDLSVAAAGVAAAIGGTAASRLLRVDGGFVVSPSKNHFMVAATAIPGNASVTLANFLRLFSADFFGARLNDWLLVTAVHLAFAGLVAVALVLALRGFRRDRSLVPYQDAAVPYGGQAAGVGVGGDLVAQLLAAAIVINLVGYGLLYPGSLSTVREIAPVFGLGGALAGRMLGGPLVRRRLEPLLAIGAAAAIITLVSSLATVVPGQPAAASLARFLSAHHLRNGVAGYWNANSTTLVSRDRIVVRPLWFRPGHGLALYLWEVDGGLLNPAEYDVNFLVATAPTPHSAAGVTSAETIAQFGRPDREYHYQGYLIMVWRKNLLRELGTYAPG
jgi:hypothetical protein